MEEDKGIQSSEQKKEIEPTGGWKQYKLAVRVLVIFPMVILLGVWLGFLVMPRIHRTQHVEVVPPTSHEPFHTSVSVLSPLHTRDTVAQYLPPTNE